MSLENSDKTLMFRIKTENGEEILILLGKHITKDFKKYYNKAKEYINKRQELDKRLIRVIFSKNYI